jgi:hypothetical protein
MFQKKNKMSDQEPLLNTSSNLSLIANGNPKNDNESKELNSPIRYNLTKSYITNFSFFLIGVDILGIKRLIDS